MTGVAITYAFSGRPLPASVVPGGLDRWTCSQSVTLGLECLNELGGQPAATCQLQEDMDDD